MFRIRNILILCLLLYLAPCTLLMAESQDGLSVDIALHNKEIYFQNSTVYVSIALTNDSSNSIRFKLAENRLFNLDVRVRTMRNQELAMNNHFVSQRNSSTVYYRDVILEPGETMSFIERINDYVQLSEVGSYVLHINFYPELYKGNTLRAPIQSNTILFSLRPGYTEEIKVRQQIDVATAEVLKKHDIAPDQIVNYMLQARQKEYWERFFLYLNLEGVYIQVPSRARSYTRASEEERVNMLENYRKAIIDGSIDEEISFVPTSFEIIETSYTPSEGKVVVHQYFLRGNFEEVKRYEYFFTRDEYWEITGYSVFNVGTQ